MRQSINDLHSMCTWILDSPQAEACRVVLTDTRFADAPGSKKHHHNFFGGLADHTFEVAEMATAFSTGINKRAEALVAAVFHDFGKIHEYTMIDGVIEQNDMLYHLPFSWEYFRQVAKDVALPQQQIDEISHAILAHHGRREWGSPIEPRTPLAFALHSADMLSMQGWRK